jgi:hypothetical protein
VRLSVSVLPVALGAVSSRSHLRLVPRSLSPWIRQAHANLRASPGLESVIAHGGVEARIWKKRDLQRLRLYKRTHYWRKKAQKKNGNR